jgi:UDP-N-acetyl-D-glucosamine dehydrogenase
MPRDTWRFGIAGAKPFQSRFAAEEGEVMDEYSVAPSGEKFPIPSKQDYAAESAGVAKLAAAARAEGKEVVVVMGVGFVGAVMAAIIADTVDRKTGRPGKFVIGCQRPSTRSYWKIPLLNRGQSPVKAEDPEVDPMIARCVNDKKTLIATYNSDCLALADCVVVDVQCDYTKHELGNMRNGEAEMTALEATMKTIGEKIQPDCLVLIETTVAPGTTEFVAYPIMKRAFNARGITSPPLLSHSFERVMPGRQYVSSIRDFWRVCSGCNAEARQRVVKFLTEVLNTEKFPLTVMDRPIESETTKIVENSYRATILAFLNEWSLFAERNGVDLIKVIGAIKVRPTHSNMIFPGPGIGGYCLPKDGGLGYWAYKHILGFEDGDAVFRITPQAIDINDTRVRVHDPYVDHWYELENQDTYPAPGHSWSRFFHNQEDLVNIRVAKDFAAAIKGCDALVLAVKHAPYLQLDPAEVVKWAGRPLAVIDCFGILTDEKIKQYLALGCEVKGLGRGHIKRLKDEVAGKARRDAAE